MAAPDPRALATLLVSCRDRRGLVAALAQLLYGHGVNIVDADQHTDSLAGYFFQRIHMDLRELHTDRVALERGVSEVAERFEMLTRIEYGERQKRVAILVSKYEHCLQDLLLRHRAGELPCEIPLVISNHEDLRAAVEPHGIAYHCLPIDRDNKGEQQLRMMELLDAERIDLVVLARYMQILTPEFCEAYAGRVINIHHSFLPAFIGGKPYHQAHRRGVKIVGATAHYATADLDEGPIIEQDVLRVSHRDSVNDLVRKGRDLERLVLSRAVRLHLEDRILIHGNKTVVFE
ncbi:MAG: formyltetrahydrofolate deformylase [Myxococcales bacterium]|nr:formyltetrahydrofolate deformylase [Myxococcales bacterium]